MLDLTALGSFFVGVAGVVTALVAWFKNKKDAKLGSTAEARMLLEVTSEQLLATLEQVERSQKQLRAQDNYISVLRDHIFQHKPPPPPEPREGL